MRQIHRNKVFWIQSKQPFNENPPEKFENLEMPVRVLIESCRRSSHV